MTQSAVKSASVSTRLNPLCHYEVSTTVGDSVCLLHGGGGDTHAYSQLLGLRNYLA
jgi:hypothetical protein